MAVERSYTVKELAKIWGIPQRCVKKYIEDPKSFRRDIRPEDSGWLTAADVARITGLSSKSIYTMTKNGTLPSHRIGWVFRYFKDEILSATRRGAPLAQ